MLSDSSKVTKLKGVQDVIGIDFMLLEQMKMSVGVREVLSDGGVCVCVRVCVCALNQRKKSLSLFFNTLEFY